VPRPPQYRTCYFIKAAAGKGLAGLAPGLQGGGLKLLGIATVRRLPNLPDLPTISETVPGVVSSGWIVLMAPAGTPDRIIQKVNADLRTVLANPEVQERFQVLGTYTRDLTPGQTGEFLRLAAHVADQFGRLSPGRF
jgi:tripartite-type tricarboxylate transporter receptor subunit TctC